MRKYIQGLIEREAYSRRQKIFLAPLFILSRVSLAIGRCREAAYQQGLLPKVKLPCRAICVGNITVGGTGKTPTVELVCRTLLQEDVKVGIISRGYGSRPSHRSGSDIFVVSDGENILSTGREAGDEPTMLAKRLPGVPVVIGKNRYLAGLKAFERFHVQTVVLDDGFQRLQLARDLNILVLDGRSPFSNGHALPVGKLRESPQALKRAHIIVLTKGADAEQKNRVVTMIRRYNKTAPVVTGIHKPRDFISLEGDKILSLQAMRGKNIIAFSGIGDPSHFLFTLKELGVSIAAHKDFPDHHWYSTEEIRQLERKVHSEKACGLITTEKDAVRVSYFPRCPVWILRIDMVLTEGKHAWEKTIKWGKNI